VQIAEKIPFLNTDNGEKENDGRVRMLTKLEEDSEFKPTDFNQLVSNSVEEMDKLLDEETAIIDDNIEEGVTDTDLVERHLSYRIKVGKVGEDLKTDKQNIAEGTSLKVIMRTQPSKAIEINGPHDVSSNYKQAIKTSFEKLNNQSLSFTDILES